MSELLKKQNYGVEVEFTGISRKMADAVAEIIGRLPDQITLVTRQEPFRIHREKWKVMRDSLSNAIQFVKLELRA